MQDRRFAIFKAIYDSLGLFLGLVQFGEQAFNAVNNALLLGKRSKRDWTTPDYF